MNTKKRDEILKEKEERQVHAKQSNNETTEKPPEEQDQNKKITYDIPTTTDERTDEQNIKNTLQNNVEPDTRKEQKEPTKYIDETSNQDKANIEDRRTKNNNELQKTNQRINDT